MIEGGSSVQEVWFVKLFALFGKTIAVAMGAAGDIFANHSSNSLRSAEINQMIIRHYQ